MMVNRRFPDLSYRFNTASLDQLRELLEVCDEAFVPTLSSRVDLKEYSFKLSHRGTLVEAWDGSSLIGVIAIYLDDPSKRVGFVSNVCVNPAYAGCGVASRLLEMSADRAAERTFSRLALEVHANNVPARTLYAKTGFRVTEGSGDILKMEFDVREIGRSGRGNGALA